MDPSKLERNNWAGGQLLAFSGIDGPTDYHHGLAARTSLDAVGIDIEIPAQTQLRFADTGPGSFLVTGDYFEIETPAAKVRGAFLDAHHILVEGPCRITNCSGQIASKQLAHRTLVGVSRCFDAEKIHQNLSQAIDDRSRWLKSRTVPADLTPETYQAMCKAFSMMKTQVSTPHDPIKKMWTTPDRWPHRGMWLWDSVFHAIGFRHIDVNLARQMLTAVIETQQDDGYIPLCALVDLPERLTQPPLLGLGAKLIHQIEPDMDWIHYIYPKLCRYVEWDLGNRDSDGTGLLEWQLIIHHDIEHESNCSAGESGMDNSPRFDAAVPLDATDFNAYVTHECEVLCQFATTLGREDDARKWADKHRQLCGLINDRLWSARANIYVDFDPEKNEQSPVLSSAGFLPLMCGAPSLQQAQHLADHLENPDTFATALPVACIAAGEYYEKDMWRGPVWMNINWLIAYGFDRYQLTDAAQHIRSASRRDIEKYCQSHSSFFEFYDDRGEVAPTQLHRKGKCAPEISPYHHVFYDYGWTAATYVDMIFSHPDS